MAKVSNRSVSIGVAVFLVGAAATYLTLHDRSGSAKAASAGSAPVLFATKGIPAGTSGATAVGEGLVGTRGVAGAARPANALTRVDQLAGRTAPTDIPAGQVLTADRFPAAQTRIGTIHVPPDKTALALQMGNVPGVAGFAGAGDRINVYGAAKNGPDGPAVNLILQDVEILNVNGTTLAPTAGQPGSPALVFLLAVSPVEAERLVYLTTFEQLYFALVPRDHLPAQATPATGPADALRQP